MTVWLRNGDPRDGGIQTIGLHDDIVPRERFGVLVELDHACAVLRETGAAELARARTEAAATRAAAQAEADALRASARAEFASAVERGLQEGRAQALEQWWSEAPAALALRQLAQTSAREHIAALVSEVVMRIVRTAAPADLFARAGQTVDRIIAEGSQLGVRVHAGDYDAACAEFGALARVWASQGRPVTVTVQADPDLPAGSCICDSDIGTIDASLEVQVAAVRQAVERAVQCITETGDGSE